MSDPCKCGNKTTWHPECYRQKGGSVSEDLDRKDRLAAEKVMGWAVHFRNTAFYVLAEEQNTGCYGKPMALVHDWHPTRNIAQAFQIVEAMRKKGFVFSLAVSQALSWEAGFHGEKEVYFGKAMNPAEAITRAAISATEG